VILVTGFFAAGDVRRPQEPPFFSLVKIIAAHGPRSGGKEKLPARAESFASLGFKESIFVYIKMLLGRAT
jgi:hypothetical protein